MKHKYEIGQLRGAFGAGYGKGQMDKGEVFIPILGVINPVGKWFHSFKDGKVNWQGQVLKRVDTNSYQCQLYGWIMGNETDIVTIHATKMSDWKFYDTDREMRETYYREYSGQWQ